MYVEFRTTADQLICEPSLSLTATIDLDTDDYTDALSQVDECSVQDKVGTVACRVFNSEHSNERITIAIHRESGATIGASFAAQASPTGDCDVTDPSGSTDPLLAEFDVPGTINDLFWWQGEVEVEDSNGRRTLPLNVKVKKVPGGLAGGG